MKKQTIYEYRYLGEDQRVFPHISATGGGSLVAVPGATYILGPGISHPLLAPVVNELAQPEADASEQTKED